MTKDEYINLWVTLIHVKDTISKLRLNESRPFHVSPEQTGVLSVLWNSPGPPTPAEISRSIIRDPSSVSIILNRMAAKGLIIKNRDTRNRNRIRVSLTDKGRYLYSEIRERIGVPRILSSLSDEECRQFQRYLETILSRAQKELEGTK